MRRFVPLMVFICLAALCLALLLRGGDLRARPSAMVGKPAPALPAAIEKPAIVNFFASWCVSCRAEQEVLDAVSRQTGVKIYGIAYKDKKDALEKFLKDAGNPFAAIVQDRDGAIGIDWGITGVPETFVIDAKGIIVYHHAGPVTDDIYRRDIQPLLNKAAP